MRKLILLVLALSLCFMIGCKEEKEPIKEIENIEVQEFEEPITEPKIDEPIEETPVEPEAEEPVAEKPEVEEPVEEIDDGKTVVVLDFPYEPYSEPELVSPEEFEWGEYFPVISYTNGEIANPGWVGLQKYRFIGCILSKEVTTLQEAKELFNLIKSKLPENDNENSMNSLYREVNVNYKLFNSLKILDQNGEELNASLEAVLYDKYVIFEGLNLKNNYYQALFSYNVETNENNVLATFAYACSISPDGKYLVYSFPTGEYYDLADISNHYGSNVLSMKKGFYVKNLENGQTTFYSCDGYCPEEHCIYHSQTPNWIAKEDYIKLKEQE